MMRSVDYSEFKNRIQSCGRTFYDQTGQVFYFNWTCSGLEFVFHGTVLIARFCAKAGSEMDLETDEWTLEEAPRKTWPWIGIFLDQEETWSRRFEVNAETTDYLIYCSDKPQTHRIRIAKLTENIKSYLGIVGFLMEGELLPFPDERPNRRIEFIGDSITCGFGNETNERDRLFYSADENGWMSHAAIAGRKLGMDWSIISSSGICVARRKSLPHPYSMEELYPYADRPIEDEKMMAADTGDHLTNLDSDERSLVLEQDPVYSRWEFSLHSPDYIVLNLGTNDATAVIGSEDHQQEEERFREDYRRFLRMLRTCNGKKPWIICALGSLDYYLYHTIVESVEDYRLETGDQRISCFRYPKVDLLHDAFGACGHPHVLTQKKMAEAIVNYIREIDEKAREVHG